MKLIKQYIYILILLLVGNNAVFAQAKEEPFIKASYVINFMEEIRWENDHKIKEFKVGVLNSPEIYTNLNNLSQDLVVRGKKVKVLSFDLVSDITKVDVLVISEAYSRKFERYEFLGKNCLLISNNSSEDNNEMIDFYSNGGNAIQFELNLDNLKNKGFVTSLKLLVFGGYSDEILGIFYESEEALKKEKEQLKKRNKEIKEKELHIWNLGKEIAKKEADIELLRADIVKGQNNLTEQTKHEQELNEKVESQKELILRFNRNLSMYDSTDKYRHRTLILMQKQLSSKKSEISDNNAILIDQRKKIKLQQSELVQKESELKTTMIAVAIITVLLFLSSVLFYSLYKSNKYKKASIKLIEEQNQKIIEGSLHKDEFIANMSHEIRTPLNAIVGFTNLLISKAKIPQNKEYLHKVLLSSNNLLNIINDILDISKIEAGKVELELIDFELHRVIQNTFYSIDIKSKSKGIEYDLNIEDDVPEFVNGDPTKVGQIIINLLNNAIKFTEKGYVKLDVGIVKKDEKEALIRFDVSDTGIGISKERVDSIFEKFTQEDVSITRKHGGTGLGLSITKSFTKLMNGTVAVESEIGKGSVFTVTLPLPIVDEPQETITESDLILVEGIENIKLIFADDHELNRESIMLQFNEWNNEVNIDEAVDGLDLVNKVEKKEYDVILTDIRMPNMSGIEAALKIRETDPHVIIIGLSANATTKGIQEGLDAGMNDYLTKPIEFNHLIHSIAQHVNLPYKLIKRNFQEDQDEDKLLARIKKVAKNKEDFEKTTNNLIAEINDHLQLINKGDHTYDTIHSLLNKTIYIGDKLLIDKTRIIQELAVEEKDDEINKELKSLESIWNEVEENIHEKIHDDEA